MTLVSIGGASGTGGAGGSTATSRSVSPTHSLPGSEVATALNRAAAIGHSYPYAASSATPPHSKQPGGSDKDKRRGGGWLSGLLG